MAVTFKHISAEETQRSLSGDGVTLVDIRDANAYAAAHIDGAQHLGNDTLAHFLTNTDKALPVIVYCYHGISSQQVAQFLVQQGFADVASMDGGYAAWETLSQTDS